MIATDWVIIALLIFIAVYDVYLMRDNRANNTISHRVYGFCKCYPWFGILLLIFTILLAGHWLLPHDVKWIWPQPVFITE